ncbi:MAG: MOSC domain-containing protein [Gammaproteobacteria bacterium]
MKLTEINIYPIKSTRRIALEHAVVEPRGLMFDRRWMLIDSRGDFITARQEPMLATVETALNNDFLTVSGGNQSALRIPLHPDGSSIKSTIWQDTVNAVVVSEAADQWFSDFIKQPCRLVCLPDSVTRQVDQQYGQPQDQVSFADGFPLLLISQASLDDLNGRLEGPVSMRRFRPNVVVSGCEPFAEDNWQRIRIGEVEFAGVKACSRCIFTTIDPDTGTKDPRQEPLRTLGTYRRREKGVFFGLNLIPMGAGNLRVGDRVNLCH